MGIRYYNFATQSALFARLSATAYLEGLRAKVVFSGMGFKSTYFECKGSQAYIVEDRNDLVVVCRGTEVKEWSDIKADASIDLVLPSVGEGQVHRGFKWYTDLLWKPIEQHLQQTREKTIWFTGHSLGAAMSTLMAQRCALSAELFTPEALFTYGSPRVGNRKFINHLNQHLTHHRWVNDGDMVTKVPMAPFYYHCGTLHHIDSAGRVTVAADRDLTLKKLVALGRTLSKGIVRKVVGDLKDHSSDHYVTHLAAWANENQGTTP